MSSLLRRLISAPRARPVLSSETIALVLRDGSEVAVQRVRHPQARRMKLSINERGVRLTLPMRASLRSADAFLHAHRDWIARQLPRWIAAADGLPFGRDTAEIPLRGEMVALRWESGRYARARIEEHGVAIALPVTANATSASRALKDFYLAQARADVGCWLPKYLPTLPRAPSAIRIRPLSSLWGSLSARDALSLDLALVLGRPEAFEYVLVHELCHLIHRNHARGFWREVEHRGADWRAQRDYLRGEGNRLKSDLRRLIAPM